MTSKAGHTAERQMSISHIKRVVNKAIREVCRSKPIEHASFTTICDLHPNQIERNLIEAVRAAIAKAERAATSKLTDDEIVELTSREAALGPDKAGGA